MWKGSGCFTVASCYVKGPLGLVLPCSQVCNSHTSAKTTYTHGPDDLLVQQVPLATYVHLRLLHHTRTPQPVLLMHNGSMNQAHKHLSTWGLSHIQGTPSGQPQSSHTQGKKPLHQASALPLMSQHLQPQHVPCTGVGKERRPLGHWQVDARRCCDGSSARVRLECCYTIWAAPQ